MHDSIRCVGAGDPWIGKLVPAESPDSASTPDPAAIQFFETEIRPILATRCHKCHGPEKQQANLRLDSRATMVAGGDSGPAVVPGKPDESLLVEAIRYEALEMPPDGKLPDRGRRADPVDQPGAAWPAGDETATPTSGRPGDHGRGPAVLVVSAGRAPGRARRRRRPGRTPIDAFILAELAEKRTYAVRRRPSGATLIRRATFDLIGLPPTPEEVEAFVADPAPDAYERLVDRLLASPHYGERWGRHWLDVVRLRRDQRLRARRRQAVRLAVPRLRHQRVQRRQAVRPVRHASSSPATSWMPVTDDR